MSGEQVKDTIKIDFELRGDIFTARALSCSNVLHRITYLDFDG